MKEVTRGFPLVLSYLQSWFYDSIQLEVNVLI